MAEAAVTEAKTKLSYLVGAASLFFAWLAMGRRPIAISDENGEREPPPDREIQYAVSKAVTYPGLAPVGTVIGISTLRPGRIAYDHV